MTSFIYSIEIIYVIVPKLWSFIWIAASVADAATANPIGMKALLANGVSIFFIKNKAVFSNGTRSPPKNTPDCTVLDSWVFW